MGLLGSDDAKILCLVDRALDILYKRDGKLIRRRNEPEGTDEKNMHVGERAVVFRFAHYLQCEIAKDETYKDFTVDVDYNRDVYEVKERHNSNAGNPNEPSTLAMIPDVVLHKRFQRYSTNMPEEQNPNLLAIECKGWWNRIKKDRTADDEKLKVLTSAVDQGYGYRYGLFIDIREYEPDLTLYKAGVVVDLKWRH